MKYKHYSLAFFCAQLVLLLLLGFFLLVWVAFGTPTNVMSQVGLQRTRAERIEKDTLVLRYDSDSSNRSQALSELQDTLPLFITAQQAMLAGGTTLNMPDNPPEAVLTVVNASASDFLAVKVAAQAVLTHHTPVDPLQVQIIVAHDRPYVIAMNTVSSSWQTIIDATFYQLFVIEQGIVVVSLGIAIVNYILTRRYRHALERDALHLKDKGVQTVEINNFSFLKCS